MRKCSKVLRMSAQWAKGARRVQKAIIEFASQVAGLAKKSLAINELGSQPRTRVYVEKGISLLHLSLLSHYVANGNAILPIP